MRWTITDKLRRIIWSRGTNSSLTQTSKYLYFTQTLNKLMLKNLLQAGGFHRFKVDDYFNRKPICLLWIIKISWEPYHNSSKYFRSIIECFHMTSRWPYCPKQWNGSHVGVPNQSCGRWTLFLCKRFLFFQ